MKWGGPTTSDEWTGGVWEITVKSSRLHVNYRSFKTNLENIPELYEESLNMSTCNWLDLKHYDLNWLCPTFSPNNDTKWCETKRYILRPWAQNVGLCCETSNVGEWKGRCLTLAKTSRIKMNVTENFWRHLTWSSWSLIRRSFWHICLMAKVTCLPLHCAKIGGFVSVGLLSFLWSNLWVSIIRMSLFWNQFGMGLVWYCCFLYHWGVYTMQGPSYFGKVY